MSTNQKIEKWAKWIEIIRDEVAYLAWSCNIYSETRQIVIDNPRINTHNHFYEWITRSHVHTTLMGIRRQLDSHCGTVSLENLLRDMRDSCNDIRDKCELLTRDQHLTLYNTEMKDLGNITFDTLAGKTAKDFPVEKIEYHLQQLEQIRSSRKTYIDKRIAHYDKGKKIEELGTFQDLDNAVSSFKEIVSQYYLLLRAEDVKSFFRIPHPQGDWKLIFRQAWISDVTTMDENG